MKLSVVIPAYQEAPHLPATMDALVGAVQRADLKAEIVVVDDGSSDGTAAAATAAVDGRLPLRVVSQPNRGRFDAVRRGLREAAGDDVLILGARVRLHPDALIYVTAVRSADRRVWNGHVHVDTSGNPYAAYLNVMTEIAWRRYFDNPRPVSFGEKDFDWYPKGSGCFLAPRSLLLSAFAASDSRFSDMRHANDDTPILRAIARSERINVSPGFSCSYVARATLGSFIRHSAHRGTVFLDGHGRRESRFFPLVIAWFPLSVASAGVLVRKPRLAPAAIGSVISGSALTAAAFRRSRFEVASVSALAPIWTLAFGAGLWRGLLLMFSKRRRSGRDG
jgi:glycosyltransferase involved in cell wall biosynthesis